MRPARSSEGARALRTTFRFEAHAAKAGLEVVALRRPDLVLRRTRYVGIVVDERVLTRGFEWKAPPSRLQVLAVDDGAITIDPADGQDATLTVGPGDVLLLTPPMASRARFDRTSFVDLEWSTAEAAALERPRVVGRLDRDRLAALAALFDDHDRATSSFVAEAIAAFRAAGAPVIGVSAEGAGPGPSDRDERIARAIEAQLSNLSSAASTLHLGELADLSPRQLQRVVGEFTATYGVNAGNWRDMRNRWRVQIAAVLLSVPELTVGDVAAEVGYATGTALARAFANAGLPPPTELRAALHREP